MPQEEKKEEKKPPEKKEGFRLGAGHLVAVLIILFFAYASNSVTAYQALMASGISVLAYIIFKVGLEARLRKDVIEYKPLRLDEEIDKIKLFLLRFDGIRVLNFEQTTPEPELAEKSSEPYNQYWKLTCLARKYDYHKQKTVWKPITVVVSQSIIMNGTITKIIKGYLGRETPSISWYGAKKYPSATEVTRYYEIKPAKIKAVPPKTDEEKEEENEG